MTWQAGWAPGRDLPGSPRRRSFLDQDYAAALTHALSGLQVQLLVRIAGDRVYYDGRPGPARPAPARPAAAATACTASASSSPPSVLLQPAQISQFGLGHGRQVGQL